MKNAAVGFQYTPMEYTVGWWLDEALAEENIEERRVLLAAIQAVVTELVPPEGLQAEVEAAMATAVTDTVVRYIRPPRLWGVVCTLAVTGTGEPVKSEVILQNASWPPDWSLPLVCSWSSAGLCGLLGGVGCGEEGVGLAVGGARLAQPPRHGPQREPAAHVRAAAEGKPHSHQSKSIPSSHESTRPCCCRRCSARLAERALERALASLASSMPSSSDMRCKFPSVVTRLLTTRYSHL
eukprot:1191202-Prorocentrum_minimum.AAC.4